MGPHPIISFSNHTTLRQSLGPLPTNPTSAPRFRHSAWMTNATKSAPNRKGKANWTSFVMMRPNPTSHHHVASNFGHGLRPGRRPVLLPIGASAPGDGLIIHMVPAAGCWPRHGAVEYEPQFFQALAGHGDRWEEDVGKKVQEEGKGRKPLKTERRRWVVGRSLFVHHYWLPLTFIIYIYIKYRV